MNYHKIYTMTMLMVASIFFISCEDDDNNNNTAQAIDPPPVTHYVVTLGAGDQWQDGLPINEQNLMDHFNYQIGLFASGELKTAGFLLAQDQGYYIQGVTTESAVNEIHDNDSGITDGVLQVLMDEPVSILVEQVPDSMELVGQQYYLIDYVPGTAWVSGKKLWEQSLEDHQVYMGDQFASRQVMRGMQYIDHDRAQYLVIAADENEVQEIINSDPAVTSGVFSGSFRWLAVNVDQL